VRPTLEVADIFRRHGEAFRAAQGHRLSPDQRRVMAAIEACRTATLGGHVEQCVDCHLVRIAYNSCRNRHCPKCQGLARAQWLADRQADLLPVPYFHVVFTVPKPLAAIALQNKAILYDILLKTAAETIRVIGADPRHLGAETGLIAVLHTWGQTLVHHPHVHCVVPGGGLAPDGRWIGCRPGFFLPVRVLSRLYRGLFIARLQAAFARGDLKFFGRLSHLAEPAAFARQLGALRQIEWVVFAKRPFAGPKQVLAYLGRYTHRVAISNSRLIACENGRVRLHWKDYRTAGAANEMTLEVDEFIRRFLLHVLPKGFRRIRHFGFLANAGRATKLARIRAALEMPEPEPAAVAEPTDYRERYAILTGHRVDLCPACGGRMVEIVPQPRSPSSQRSPAYCDTS
jgi:Putative transposase/Transposase zinc-binding domain